MTRAEATASLFAELSSDNVGWTATDVECDLEEDGITVMLWCSDRVRFYSLPAPIDPATFNGKLEELLCVFGDEPEPTIHRLYQETGPEARWVRNP